MTASDPAKKFAALIKRARAQVADAPLDPAHEGRTEVWPRTLWQLVFSILAWNASPARAVAASRRLHDSVIDYNELRVCLVEEIAAQFGERYPDAIDRATRVRSVLNDIYRRHHAVTLDHLPGMNKRDARTYLESLDGCPSYAAARVALLELDAHAIPVDGRIRAALQRERALPLELDDHAASAWIERQLRAGEAADAYVALESLANAQPRAAETKAPAAEPATTHAPAHRSARSSTKPKSAKKT